LTTSTFKLTNVRWRGQMSWERHYCERSTEKSLKAMRSH